MINMVAEIKIFVTSLAERIGGGGER